MFDDKLILMLSLRAGGRELQPDRLGVLARVQQVPVPGLPGVPPPPPPRLLALPRLPPPPLAAGLVLRWRKRWAPRRVLQHAVRAAGFGAERRRPSARRPPEAGAGTVGTSARSGRRHFSPSRPNHRR